MRGAVDLVAHQAHGVGDVAAVGELLADGEAERLLELVDLRAEGGRRRVGEQQAVRGTLTDRRT